MAESAKVRVVRCPKCENLLPELEDYPVYQCGGCGAVLRAKVKNPEADTLSVKSEEEKIGEVSSKSPNSSEKRIAVLSDASDTDKSNSGSLSCDQRLVSEKNDLELADRCANQYKVTNDNWCVERSLDVNTRKDETDNATGIRSKKLNSLSGYTFGSQGSGRMSDWQTGERSEVEGSHRTTRTYVGGSRFPTSSYPDEGPSNYHPDSSYSYREPLRNRIGSDGASRVLYLEQDRAELLRKLDELNKQLSRSCDVADKPKEKVPVDGRILPSDPYGGSDSWLPNGSLRSERSSMPFLGPNKRVAGPSYFNHSHDPFPSNGHEMPLHSLHPSIHNPNHVPGYGDPFGSQMLRRASNQLPSQYQQPPSHPYFPGQYIDTNHDPFDSYQQNAIFHQPSCSCYHCYDKHQQVSAPVQPTACGNKPNNSMLYHHEIPGAFTPHVHNFRAAVPSSNFHGPQAHTRWPSDLNSKEGGFVRCCPRKVVLANGGHRCRPKAGGAPFLTCNNCFELLQLPKKAKLMVKNQQKLQCGTCSSIIKFEVINKKLVLSAQAETKQTATEADNNSSEAVKDYISHSRGHLDRSRATFSSDDYDNFGYDFEAMDREPVPLSTGQVLNLAKPQEMQSFHSSSPSTSGDETSPEVLIAREEVINCIQQPVKATLSSPPAGLSLQEHFIFSSHNHAVKQFGKGKRSIRTGQEKSIPNRVTTRQNSLKEESLATEMEVSLNEYSNTVISQDSEDAIREDDMPRNNKEGESFFANIFKKSFKTEERCKSNVSVNGHIIPGRKIKKAEKLAGPIHPGHYWYDIQGGFWGIMGGPCQGIILPYIEELNYPMPANCAGGNTGVFVNGRELHQEDLDLLARRGLPTDRDRSYIIEISGRVVDVDTGEELDSLGKLAPTVENARHGFGMKPPRAAAQ